jgi:hypothetical protein
MGNQSSVAESFIEFSRFNRNIPSKRGTNFEVPFENCEQKSKKSNINNWLLFGTEFSWHKALPNISLNPNRNSGEMQTQEHQFLAQKSAVRLQRTKK